MSYLLAEAMYMSKLIFNGAKHLLSLIGSDGKIVGTWTAYNNVDSHAAIIHVPDGTYIVLDRKKPHHHRPDPNGPYGMYGIVRFKVPDHPGIGVHSGRADAHHFPGPQHPTHGCIRTTDEAMKSIATFMKTSHLGTIKVIHNYHSSHHSSTNNHTYLK